jgi:predicted transcriptional regulator
MSRPRGRRENPVSYRLDDETVAAIERLADKLGLSRGQLVALAVRELGVHGAALEDLATAGRVREVEAYARGWRDGVAAARRAVEGVAS